MVLGSHHWWELLHQVVMPLPHVSTQQPTHLPMVMTTTADPLPQSAPTMGPREQARTTMLLHPETTRAMTAPQHSSSKVVTQVVAMVCSSSSRASPMTARRHCRHNPSSSEKKTDGVDGRNFGCCWHLFHYSAAEVLWTCNCCWWCTLQLSRLLFCCLFLIVSVTSVHTSELCPRIVWIRLSLLWLMFVNNLLGLRNKTQIWLCLCRVHCPELET